MPKSYLTINDLLIQDKTVILRVDINSPVNPETGKLLSTTRINSHIKTIERLSDARVVILGHQSRPGKEDYISLNEHANHIRSLLRRPVKFVDDLIGSHAREAIKRMNTGDIVLLENVRFFAEEIALKNDPIDTQSKSHIIQNILPLADYFINDAFAAAHRAQPSLVGFTEMLPSAAGLVMEKELTALDKVLTSGKHPCIAVLGGQKVEDSLDVAKNMLTNKVVDKILTTGVVANIFLLAKGYKLGKPNIKYLESEFKDLPGIIYSAKNLLEKYKKNIVLPVDVVGNKSGERAPEYVEKLPIDYPIYDVGLETIVKYSNMLKDAKIIIANGPAGVFEIEEFSFGTNEIFLAIAKSNGYSVVGGGESIVVVDKLGIESDIDHISTGGGACINYLAGRKLPVVEALKKSKKLFAKKLKKK